MKIHEFLDQRRIEFPIRNLRGNRLEKRYRDDVDSAVETAKQSIRGDDDDAWLAKLDRIRARPIAENGCGLHTYADADDREYNPPPLRADWAYSDVDSDDSDDSDLLGGAMPGVFNPQDPEHWPTLLNGNKALLPRSGNIRHGLQTEADCAAFGVRMPINR